MPKSAPISKTSAHDVDGAPHLPEPVFRDDKHHIRIFQGDCLDILAALPENTFDLIFADPPYFLSNNGITCHAGRMVSVNKGEWDRSRGADGNHGLRFFKIAQIYPLIDAAIRCFQRNECCGNRAQAKVFVKLLGGMEKYHFVNNAICDRIGNEVEKLYARFCTEFDASKSFEMTTDELLKELRKQLASEEEFTTRFRQVQYSSENIPLIAYIFDRINNYGLAPGERIPIFSPHEAATRRNHNIEHFLSQKPEDEASIESDTREVVDNIGNLLVVSFRANSSLGNLSPRKKVEKMLGPLARKIQNMPYIRSFVHKYDRSFDS